MTQEELIQNIDINYSYRLAKKMEGFRTNPVLGYRTAGSKAEFETGEMLKEEMLQLGLSNVTKDAIHCDGWEFKRAILSFQTTHGEQREIQLGAYQTTFVTNGPKEFSLVYVGKGTEKDYEGLDVTGKLVLVDINQRDEWWINYPVYQAHLKNAAAVIAAQSGGYGEIDGESLNAQDIAGPEDAPAFSISGRDAAILKELICTSSDDPKGKYTGEIKVLLDADSRVIRDCVTYNITGQIPGKHPERIVMFSAHYDSYFSGFQDDNTAISMMLGIAKAYLASGLKPENTLLFCAMAAEEWGVADSNFDWSTGAYEQVFTAHPEWVGKVIADLNFELPALAHGTRARIRSCYEYTRYLKEYVNALPELTKGYPDATSVTAPIETWSDDFSIAISGIPSMVNDFTGGSFMETHYHSQFDNDDFYDEKVYRLHHELFLLLADDLNKTAVVPLCFTPVLEKAEEILEKNPIEEICDRREAVFKKIEQEAGRLKADLLLAKELAEKEYEKLQKANEAYREALACGNSEAAEEIYISLRSFEECLLKKFKAEQDHFVRIDWYGNVQYPHEILFQKLMLTKECMEALKASDAETALKKLYHVDNNAYAFMFDKEVYDHFTEYVLHQPKDRLKWGYHRLMEHENLYDLVKSLLAKAKNEDAEYSEELCFLEKMYNRQCNSLVQVLGELCRNIEENFL